MAFHSTKFFITSWHPTQVFLAISPIDITRPQRIKIHLNLFHGLVVKKANPINVLTVAVTPLLT